MADKMKGATAKAPGTGSTGCVFCDLDLEAQHIDGAWVHVTKQGNAACSNPEQMKQEPPPPPLPPRVALAESQLPVAEGLSADEPIAAAAAGEELPDASTPGYLEAIAEIRARRKQFGASAQKLALPERRGYHRHWFNDSPGRIEESLNNGWAHVLGQDRKPVRRVVGTGRDNRALTAYAMEIPTPIWEQDQAVLHKAAQDRLDQVKGAGAFRAPTGTAKRTDEGKFYSPTEEPVKVSESVVRV